jgi:hypothetical protein
MSPHVLVQGKKEAIFRRPVPSSLSCSPLPLVRGGLRGGGRPLPAGQDQEPRLRVAGARRLKPQPRHPKHLLQGLAAGAPAACRVRK